MKGDLPIPRELGHHIAKSWLYTHNHSYSLKPGATANNVFNRSFGTHCFIFKAQIYIYVHSNSIATIPKYIVGPYRQPITSLQDILSKEHRCVSEHKIHTMLGHNRPLWHSVHNQQHAEDCAFTIHTQHCAHVYVLPAKYTFYHHQYLCKDTMEARLMFGYL